MTQSGASSESEGASKGDVGGNQPDRPRPIGRRDFAKQESPGDSRPRRKKVAEPESAVPENPAAEPGLVSEPPNPVPTVSGGNVQPAPPGLMQKWLWRLRLLRVGRDSSRQATRRARVLGEIATSGCRDPGSLVRPFLADQWVVVREAAAKALGGIQSRESAADLVHVLTTDESPAVRHAAAMALCQLKDPESIPSLLQFAQTFPKLSISIGEGIFRMGRDGVPRLIKSLEEGDSGLRVMAIDLLGRLGDPRSARPLVKGLSHPDERVRTAAARSLGNLHDRRVELPLRQALTRENSATVIAALLRSLAVLGCDYESSEFLPFLSHIAANCREAACQLMGRYGDIRAAGTFVHLLKDAEPTVRREAALALGLLASPQALSPLVQVLDDPSDHVRAAACRALGGLHDPRALAPLCRALGDDYEGVRSAAAAALGLLGDPDAVAPLCEAVLMERVQEPQIACIRALGQLAAPSSLPVLKELLRRPTQVKTQAVVAIGQVATAEAVDMLLPLLEDPQAIVRYHATLGLGNIGDQRAIPALERRISDSETLVLRGLVRAMGHFATAQSKILRSRAESALREALNRPQEPTVQVESRKTGSTRRISGPASWLILAALGAAVALGLWFARGRNSIPEGTASGASIAFSRGDIAGIGASTDPNELRVATSGGWLERWNIVTGKLVSRSDTRIDIGSTAKFSEDGSLLVTLRGNHLVICEASTGEERSKVRGSPGLRWLRLDSRGEELASWEPDKGMTIWSLPTGQPVWQIDRDPELPWSCVSATRDFQRVAIGLTTGDVLVFDTGSKRRMIRLKAVLPQPVQLEFSPDGKVLAVVNGRGQVVLMDPTANRLVERQDSGVSGISAIAWTSQGDQIVGIGGDAVFLMARRGGQVTRVPFADDVNRAGLVFDQLWVDPSDRHVAAASTEGRVVLLWRLPQLSPQPPLLAP